MQDTEPHTQCHAAHGDATRAQAQECYLAFAISKGVLPKNRAVLANQTVAFYEQVGLDTCPLTYGKYVRETIGESSILHKSPPGPVTYWGANDRKNHKSRY
eukprot:2663950-Pyramimonas_sp.AAC.1